MSVVESRVRENTIPFFFGMCFVSKINGCLILCVRIEASICYPSKTQSTIGVYWGCIAYVCLHLRPQKNTLKNARIYCIYFLSKLSQVSFFITSIISWFFMSVFCISGAWKKKFYCHQLNMKLWLLFILRLKKKISYFNFFFEANIINILSSIVLHP